MVVQYDSDSDKENEKPEEDSPQVSEDEDYDEYDDEDYYDDDDFFGDDDDELDDDELAATYDVGLMSSSPMQISPEKEQKEAEKEIEEKKQDIQKDAEELGAYGGDGDFHAQQKKEHDTFYMGTVNANSEKNVPKKESYFPMPSKKTKEEWFVTPSGKAKKNKKRGQKFWEDEYEGPDSFLAESQGTPAKETEKPTNQNFLFFTNQLKSKPDGDFIENIHRKWAGDYYKLESHHGFIQWLFPLPEPGMNSEAQTLTMEEIKDIRSNEKALDRLLRSYELMLDFYGMKLVNRATGEISKAPNWRGRFMHLNQSSHNYLRITRILKCFGLLGMEKYQFPFVDFCLKEIFETEMLENARQSCINYWIPAVSDEALQQQLCESVKQYEENEEEKLAAVIRPKNKRKNRKGRRR